MPNFSSRDNSTRAYEHPKAHNPEEFDGDTVRLYRGGVEDGDTLGIHWTTDPTMVIQKKGYKIHSVDAPRDAILPRTEWFDRSISRDSRWPHEKEEGKDFAWSPTQWGFDIEQEVRLRPGAVVQNHAIGEYDPPESSEITWKPTGRSPVIDVNPEDNYKNLAHAAVQGTPQAESLHKFQQSLPHALPPLPFEYESGNPQSEFVDPISGKSMGISPDFFGGDLNTWYTARDKVENKLIAKHGELVSPKEQSIGRTVPLSELTDHMGPQFKQPQQPALVDPDHPQLPGMED